MKYKIKFFYDTNVVVTVDADDAESAIEKARNEHLAGKEAADQIMANLSEVDVNFEEADWTESVRRVPTEEEEEIYIHILNREVYADLKFKDGFAYNDELFMRYPKVGELTPDDLRVIDKYTGGRIRESGYVTPYDVCLLLGDVVSFGIMDKTNGHNAELVDQVNIRWVEDKELFEPILCALYERDIREIADADSFKITKWVSTPEYETGVKEGKWEAYMALALADMKARWMYFAENYLMHIADDQDLETILTFVRYDRSDH